MKTLQVCMSPSIQPHTPSDRLHTGSDRLRTQVLGKGRRPGGVGREEVIWPAPRLLSDQQGPHLLTVGSHPGVGDDLIGPKDIKRGLHLLTNANMAVLEASGSDEPEEEGPGAEPDLERGEHAGGAREAHAQGELLSDDQINQARDPSDFACLQGPE